jgi:hypothetical protein
MNGWLAEEANVEPFFVQGKSYLGTYGRGYGVRLGLPAGRGISC